MDRASVNWDNLSQLHMHWAFQRRGETEKKSLRKLWVKNFQI